MHICALTVICTVHLIGTGCYMSNLNKFGSFTQGGGGGGGGGGVGGGGGWGDLPHLVTAKLTYIYFQFIPP